MWFPLVVVSCLTLAAATDSTNDIRSERSPATVRIHHERSTESKLEASVEAFGKTHQLILKKIELPEVHAEEISFVGNVSVTRTVTGDDSSTRYYEDEKSGAVLFMDDKNTLEGMLTDSISLKFENNQYTAAKINRLSTSKFCATPHSSKRDDDDSLPEVIDRTKAAKSAVKFYVELHVMIDSKLANYIGTSRSNIQYQKVFWKMVYRRYLRVDRRFARIALKVNYIVISRSIYTDNRVLHPMGPSHAHIHSSIYRFSRYMGKYRRSYRTHDVAYLMTGRNLAVQHRNGLYTGYLGRALGIGQVCRTTSRFAYNTAIGEDDSYYSGMLTAAHEVAHVLGSYHDGQGTSKSCSWYWGYMMSNIRNSYRTFYFSWCSSKAMKLTYLRGRYGNCLKRKYGKGMSIPKYHYPGFYTPLNEQCRLRSGMATATYSPYWRDYQQCYRLRCIFSVGYFRFHFTSYFPALEGTPCNRRGYFCADGYCRYLKSV